MENNKNVILAASVEAFSGLVGEIKQVKLIAQWAIDTAEPLKTVREYSAVLQKERQSITLINAEKMRQVGVRSEAVGRNY